LSLYALNIVYSSQEELAFRENLKKLLEAKHRYIQSIIDSGISSGTVVSGKIGSKNGKLDFTVIGDTVNMAARLKSMAEKESESCIIVSDKVGNKIKDYWNLIELEPVAIKGKAGKFKTWRISEEI
jgi:class 3 adenylate cyclase